METSVEWIIFTTEHYESMKRFYSDTLRLTIVRDVPEEEFTQFSMANQFIAIYGKSFVSALLGRPITGTPGSTIYSLKASENVDLTYQQLVKDGVQFIRPPETQPWGQRTAYFTDPDGNIWEIQQWVQTQ